MVLDLNTTIGFSILLPFTLGKLDPRRTIQLVHLLIRGIQVVTDPVVNTVGLVLQKLLFGPLLRTVRSSLALDFSILSQVKIGPEMLLRHWRRR